MSEIETQNFRATLELAGLPEEEKAALRHLPVLISNFSEFRQRYINACALIGFTRKADIPELWRIPAAGWPMMACRDAAISLNHLGITIQAIVSAVNKSVIFKKFVKIDDLNKLSGLFDKNFQAAYSLRSAVAHSGDFEESPENYSKHATKMGYNSDTLVIEGGGLLTIDILDGNRYTKNVNGKLYSIDLTWESTQVLWKMGEIIHEAIAPATNQPWLAEIPPHAPPPEDQTDRR